ncbi:MAG TPA: calcium-binding protein [Candidatus Nitrosocosmicus sp.]
MSSIYLRVPLIVIFLLMGFVTPQIINMIQDSLIHFAYAFGPGPGLGFSGPLVPGRFSGPINPLILDPDYNLLGRTLPVPSNPLTPPNQAPVTALTRSLIAAGLELPKNLIVPTCPQDTTTSSQGTGCPPIVGTIGPDIIIASAVQDATIFGISGNDVIQCGTGNCKVYGGTGDNIMMAGSSTTSQLFGGAGDNTFIGGTGDALMVGGKGNDQFYAGTGHDIMIGGGGRNYFDCGTDGNGVILDFNAKNGDTKASDCKFIVTVKTGIPNLP